MEYPVSLRKSEQWMTDLLDHILLNHIKNFYEYGSWPRTPNGISPGSRWMYYRGKEVREQLIAEAQRRNIIA